MVKQLDPGIANEILALIKQGFALTKQGDFVAAETYYLSAWEKIPEPKFSWDVSESTLRSVARFYRNASRFEEAKAWMNKLFDSGSIAPYDAEPCLLLGTIHYEAGELDLARKYLQEADRISKGRAFQDQDPKYYKFLKQKQKP
jgi:tetratricopeptide (TPR) repeat protein